jgi:hypothetical protein
MPKIFFTLAILAAVFYVLPAQAAYIPMSGDLIKTTSSPAVYIVDDNLKRHLFSNEATFWTWYSGGWANQNIKIVSQDDFDILDTGKNITARVGTNLIQFDNSNKVYAVTPGGVLCEVRALYGDDWLTRVIKIQASFETDYIKDNSCTIISTGKLPDASLIQYVNSSDIWYISGGQKRKVSADGFKANDLKQSSIIKNVPTTMTYGNGKAISVYESTLGILYSLTYSRQAEISGRPDLVITDIVFPASRIVVNQTISLQLVIRNIGGNLTSELGLKNIVFSGTDWTTINISHPDYPTANNPLQTGQTFTVTYTGRFIGSGDKNFTAKVNEPSEITELNQLNNGYSERATVYSN